MSTLFGDFHLSQVNKDQAAVVTTEAEVSMEKK